MSTLKRFTNNVEEVHKLNLLQQNELLFLFLGGLSAMLERPTVKKSDINKVLENALNYCDTKLKM